MPVILSIESTTTVCSVSLHKGGNLLAAEQLHVPQSQASKLAILVTHILESTGVDASELNAVAVSVGPGSYTGLRIGTSLAKGLCLGLSIPLIGLDSLLILANSVAAINTDKYLLCPMIDARRMEVYCSVFDSSLRVMVPGAARIIDEKSFRDLLERQTMLFFGDGAPKCKPIIAHPNARFLEDIQCNAISMGQLAYHRFQRSEFEDLHQFVPNYGKEYEAKVSRVSLS